MAIWDALGCSCKKRGQNRRRPAPRQTEKVAKTLDPHLEAFEGRSLLSISNSIPQAPGIMARLAKVVDRFRTVSRSRRAGGKRVSRRSSDRWVRRRLPQLEALEPRMLLTWTVLVYLDGDNDLESAAVADVYEMEQVGSTSEVNVVAQFDRTPGFDGTNGDWIDTRRARIVHDTNTSTIDSNFTSIGEVNMGDPNALKDFIQWGVATYPADHYMLDLWDHGNGLGGVCWDDTNNSDYLSLAEVRQGIGAAGTHMDVVGFDASLMGMQEMGHEIHSFGNVMVASEDLIPTNNWPYDTILTDLTANANMTAAQLGAAIVQRYGQSYGDAETLSALNLASDAALSSQLDAFARAAMRSGEWTTITNARSAAASFSDPDFRDLGSVLQYVGSQAVNPGLAAAASTAYATYQSAILANHSGSSEGGTGLTVYLPAQFTPLRPDYTSANYLFVKDTTWRQFLTAYVNNSPPLPELDLVSVSTNVTTYQRNDSPTMDVAPREFTFRFNEQQVIDPATLAGIQISRAGADGVFYDSDSNPDDIDDVVINPGWIGIGERSNEVIFRPASALPDDLYHVTFVGKDNYHGPDGKAVAPLQNTTGTAFEYGQNFVWSFDLQLAPQVIAVVPQPVTRDPVNGTLSQARDQIEVYFSDKMFSLKGGVKDSLGNTWGSDPAKDYLNPRFFQLIATQDSANTTDDPAAINPTAAVYSYDPVTAVSKAILTFAADLANLIPGSNSTGAFRLRIGNQYRPIITTERADVADTVREASSTFADATNLGNFSVVPPTEPTGQSWVISGDISERPYLLEWPGGQDEPGHRNLPTGPTDVNQESHVPLPGSGDTGPYGTIPTYYYNFKADYGTVQGSPLKNLITDVQKQRVREIFLLITQYFGVQFVETADQPGMQIVTGDIRAIDPNATPGAGSAIEATQGGNGTGMTIANNYYSSPTPGAPYFGNCEFGGTYVQAVMGGILFMLNFRSDFDLPPFTVMQDAGNTDPDRTLPANADVIHGQYLYRPDSMDIDLYKFQVDQQGELSAETIAQRLQNSSLLNTTLVLYDAQRNVIARNDDYFGKDSFIGIALQQGTYYLGVSASGNSQYDPSIPDSGVGGTTEGPYQLRLNFRPHDDAQLLDPRQIALDGDGDGTPGGVYNYWFNVAGSKNKTIFVDKSVPSGGSGTLGSPYNAIPAAWAAAQAGDVVRIVGNKFDYDNHGHSILAVRAMDPGPPPKALLTDGQTFTISDGKVTFTFELDSNNAVAAGNIRVGFTPFDDAPAIATKLANAINSMSWIPPDLRQRRLGGLYARATVTGPTLDIVSVDGPADGSTVVIDLGRSGLKLTLQDNKAYEIGTDPLGNTLADGKKLDVPKGVTLMIDAGAAFKLRGANIDVGSSAQNIDRSLGALQVLGTPGASVYFTSYLDERLGVDTYTNATTPAAGDWGGLVFRNNYDYDERQADPTRRVLEQEGIFLDYVNHADLRYGGGKVTVNGNLEVYDPIHMIEARPTVSFNTITNSADAAFSADPNSLEESEFHDRFGETLYTADYGRVGPIVHGNTLAKNSLNGLFLRIHTLPGQPLKQLEVAARFDDLDTVLTIPENLVIHNSDGALAVTGTSPLEAEQHSHNQLVVPNGASFQDRQSFILSDTYRTVRFEFDLLNDGVATGSEQIVINSGDFAATIAAAIAARINNPADANHQLKITATVVGNNVVLGDPSANTTPTVVIQGLTGQQARAGGRFNIDPGAVVKLGGSRIEAGFGSQFLAEGVAGYPIVFTSLLDDTYGAGGTFDTTNNGRSPAATAGNWGGMYFGPTSQGSIDHARIYYAGGNVSIEGGFANFEPIEIRQAAVRLTNTLLQFNAANTTLDERNGRGQIVRTAVIHVRGAQPILVNNIIRDNPAAAISIDVNSLSARSVPDWGRSTGSLDAFQQYADNDGPLVRSNRLTKNSINGMIVRGNTLTTEGVWDDTDIAHVVYDEIVVPNFHTYGGLRLKSSATDNLVVKLSGASAGFTASGSALEIEDRIGGTLQLLGAPALPGTPSHPVILTALADDSVSAGFDPNGMPQFDTDNVPNSQGTPGAWRSVQLDRYSNDRNVAVIHEAEPAFGTTADLNGNVNQAQQLGQLAQQDKGGDDVLRLGFEVHGYVELDKPLDVDMYKFQGSTGSEVWIGMDRTAFSLDTVIELVDADGSVLARSNNWVDESRQADAAGLGLDRYLNPDILGTTRQMRLDDWGYKDSYSFNPRDAGMRLVLPGPQGERRTYYLRVYSSLGIGGIDANHVPIIANLDGKTFQITFPSSDGTNHTVTFEFVDQHVHSDPAPGNKAVLFDSLTDSIDVIRTAMVGAINAVLKADNPNAITSRAQALPDGSIALYGPGVVLSTGTTPFSQLGRTRGAYQLQVRLSPIYEHPGSTVRYADIHYATNGIEVLGEPGHSPLQADAYDSDAIDIPAANRTANTSFAAAQPVGNLLRSDQNMINIAGYMNGYQDVSWYQFTVDYGSTIKSGVAVSGSTFPVIFDLDYADGMARPDAVIYVFDQNQNLILSGDDSNIVDDQPSTSQGANVSDLSRGTFGTHDAYIGPVYLPGGQTYYVAVASKGAHPDANSTQPLLRWEPVDSLNRVAEDNVGSQNDSDMVQTPPYTLFPGNTSSAGLIQLNLAANPFHLGDVTLYVSTNDDLYTVDPFTGAGETDVTDTGWLPQTHVAPRLSYGDIAMRQDGELYAMTRNGTGTVTADAGQYQRLNTGDARTTISNVFDGINTYQVTGGALAALAQGVSIEAMSHSPDIVNYSPVYVVGNRPRRNLTPSPQYTESNLLFKLDINGNAVDYPDPNFATGPREAATGTDPVTGNLIVTGTGTEIVPMASLTDSDDPSISVGFITGLAFLGTGRNARLYAVDDQGHLFQIENINPYLNVTDVAANNPEWAFVPVTANGTTVLRDSYQPRGGSGHAQLHYIATISGNPAFEGLTAGPPNVENALYADTLFGVDDMGRLFAFDTEGNLQPIFLDGSTSVQLRKASGAQVGTSTYPVSGVAFSNIDYNLWHVTDNRRSDDGHGVNPTYDDSRLGRTTYSNQVPAYTIGDTSFYFGLEDPTATNTLNTSPSSQPGAAAYQYWNSTVYQEYDCPGGAYGSLTTQPFSLEGYSAADAPMLYFNYFLNRGTAANFDSARVFASGDGANWTRLTDTRSGLTDLPDTGSGWQQFRGSLAAVAGQSQVRVRIDFAAAGDMEVGNNSYTGAYLEALSGDLLEDSDSFTVSEQTFQFDLGVALRVPNVAGDSITKPETFTIMNRDALGNLVALRTFELLGTGASGNVPIPIAVGETTAQVAARIAQIVNAQSLVNGKGVAIFADVYENRVMFNGAEGLTQSANPTLVARGNGYGIYGSSTRVVIRSDQSADQVALAIAGALDQRFSGRRLIHVVLPTPLTLLERRTFSLTDDAYRTVLFEFDSDGTLLNPLAQRVTFDPATDVTADAIAARIVTAIGSSGLSITPVALPGGFVQLGGPAALFTPDTPPSGQRAVLVNVFTASKVDKSLLHMIGHTVSNRGPLPYSTKLPGDPPPPSLSYNPFTDFRRGQDNAHEGFYVDDVLVGFAERGDMITHATPDSAFTFDANAPTGIVSTGYYQLQIRRASDYAVWPVGVTLELVRSFDTNDRLNNAYTLTAPAARDIAHETTFVVSDGVQAVTFQFLGNEPAGNHFPGGSSDYAAIYFDNNESAAQLAARITQAVNDAYAKGLLQVTAVAGATSDRVDLFGAARVSGLPAIMSDIQFTDQGDSNHLYDQGQVILEANKITNSRQYGITVAGSRAADNLPHPGPTAPLREVNLQRLVPSVTIFNNVLAFGGTGGIKFGGDDLPASGSRESIAAVPFGRIVNNTIFGQSSSTAVGVGINVGPNASPTILNNVVANLDTGIQVDATSGTTVVGTTAYARNRVNLTGVSDFFPLLLQPSDPLFVNPDFPANNFYPAAGSPIIDSSLDALPDRQDMLTVRQPLGIPESPILVPERDLFGQLRTDDPKIAPPSGFGDNTYKDRGAIDRVDFEGPTGAEWVTNGKNQDIVDNDSAGLDRNPGRDDMTIFVLGSETITQFVIQLSDGGAGVDNSTVTTSTVQVFKDGVRLADGPDYFFVYDSTNHKIMLQAAAGAWAPRSIYVMKLDNSAGGIRDLAGNPIQPNRTDMETRFSVALTGFDFGDAPMFTDLAHKISATTLPEGARHQIVFGVHLGNLIDNETDARVNDTATGDPDDDGVTDLQGNSFQGTTLISQLTGAQWSKTIQVSASTGGASTGVLDAWIDWDGDGVWDPTTDKISFTNGGNLSPGVNTLTFSVPNGKALSGTLNTFARFRFSTTGKLSNGQPMQPTGEAADGEVEDYQVSILSFQAITISGTKYEDLTGDKFTNDDVVLGSSNPHNVAVTLNLYKDHGTASVGTTTTDANGNYSFPGLGPGQYSLSEVVPSGWLKTDARGGAATGWITAQSGVDMPGNDFDNFKQITLSGTKYEDLTGNQFSSDDVVLGSSNPHNVAVPLNLYKDGGASPVATATTDANGNYSFPGLAPGQYSVSEVAPPGWQKTDARGAAATGTITATSGNDSSGNDFDNFKLITLSGTKYEDLTGNKFSSDDVVLGSSNPHRVAVPVNLYKDGGTAPVATATTDAGGRYTFSALGPGQYSVSEVVPAGWLKTDARGNAATGTLAATSGNDSSGNDFDNFKLITLSGTKYEDLTGNKFTSDDVVLGTSNPHRVAVTVNLYKNGGTTPTATAPTDANGRYSFTALGPGQYSVGEVVPAGWLKTDARGAAATGTITATSGSDSSGNDFDNFKQITISGTKYEDLTGNKFSSDDVVLDSSNPHHVTVTVNLYKNGGTTPAATAPTDANGRYSFTALGPGQYSVGEVVPAGWLRTDARGSVATSIVTATSGNDSSGNDFDNFKLVTVSGQKFKDSDSNGSNDVGDPKMPGWTIQLDLNSDGSVDLTQVTDTNGNYSFSGIGPGTHTLSEAVQPGWVQTCPKPVPPGTYVVTPQSGQDLPGKDFGNIFLPVDISGQKFNDLSGNGIKDPGDAGLPGLTIQLDLNSDGSTDQTQVTDSNGNYKFAGIGPGTHTLSEVVAQGWIQTSPTPVPPGTYVLTPQSGVNLTGKDFGNFQLVTISGQKFNDLNQNGIKDFGEPGLPGWTIQLDLSNDGTVDRTQVTDGNGNYTFTGIGPGAHKLSEVSQPDWVQTAPTSGIYLVTTQSGQNLTRDFGNTLYVPPARGGSLGVFVSGFWALDRNRNLAWDAPDGGPLTFGWDGATPVVGDWNGDGNTEIGVYSNGVWWLDTNANGMWDRTEPFFYYGWQGATAVVGDWNGDGTDDVGVYNLGVWFRDVNGSRTWDAPDQNSLVYFGWGGAIPTPGQWNNDRKDEVGVYANSAWLRDVDGDNQWDGGSPDQVVYYGWNGATPVLGDWNSDGKDEVGLYAGWHWYRDVNGNGRYDAPDQAALTYFGSNGNGRPVVGSGSSMPFPVVGNWAAAAAPLLAAGPAPTASAHLPALSNAQLQPIVTEAIARWSAAGLTAPALDALRRLEFVIADLPDSYLGKAEGSRITLDRDAAGHGWFIDPTPKQDEEFVSAGLFHGKQAIDPRAVDRIDLLTVVEHELGHIAGLRDLAPSVDDLMSQRLGTGVRRSPDQADVDAVFTLGRL